MTEEFPTKIPDELAIEIGTNILLRAFERGITIEEAMLEALQVQNGQTEGKDSATDS